MRRLILLLLLAVPLSAAEPKLDDLKWLVGHWTATVDGVQMEELWLPPSGGMMLGLHRDVKKDRASFEFIRIQQTSDAIVYFAQPGGRPPTPFRLVEVSANRAIFANPEHDFPQRITYWTTDGGLCARVSGKIKDNEESEEWCWTLTPSSPAK